MNLFKSFFSNKTNTDTKPVIEPSKTIAANHISKKKKNTYEIALSGAMVDTSCFRLCKATPLAVIILNGKQVQENTTGFLSCTEFPNPYASEMQSVYKQMAGFDKKIATTIIEYLDKDTNQPVLYVFPHGVHINDGYEQTYAKHLNHASRRDLDKQIKLRQELASRVSQNRR